MDRDTQVSEQGDTFGSVATGLNIRMALCIAEKNKGLRNQKKTRF